MEDTAPVEQTTPPAPELETPPTADTPATEAAAPVSEATAAESESAAAGDDAGAPSQASAAATIEPDAAALAALAERSISQRLPAADEETAAKLVQAGLLAGKEEQAAVVASLPKLGWSAAVKGVTAAWPAMKATAKNAFIKGLGADESEAGRRIRLSVARGLFKVPDVATASKLVLSVAKDIRNKDTGEIPPKDAQHFAHVMIGKGKPWIAQLPTADMKPADVALLVHCAVVAAFSVGGPPVTPLGVLKWAAELGQLNDLNEVALNSVTRSVGRWSPKWADALRKEVPTAPESILGALKSGRQEGETNREQSRTPDDGDATGAERSPTASPTDEEDGLPAALRESPSSSASDSAGGAEGDRRERPVYVSKTVPPKDGRPQPQQGGGQAPSQPQAQPQPRPEPSGGREGRGAPAKSPQFNASEVLRQLESHIGWLKGELQTAEKKLRTREDDRRQVRRKVEAPVIEGEPTPEELARVNVQLEARITELQARIDDLTADAEARATSSGAFADGPAPDTDTQLRTLLGLKLRECYADFFALEQEDRDLVIPQHYRTVLAEVFEVLRAEKVPLDAEPSESPAA